MGKEDVDNYFIVGDRVIVDTGGAYETADGQHGTIICAGINGCNWGIECDADIEMHDCDGLGKYGHCIWVFKEWFRPEDPSAFVVTDCSPLGALSLLFS